MYSLPKYNIAQFCGCSPRERVNHVYFVLCMIGILYLSFIYYYCIAKVDMIDAWSRSR
jgi:hypothetical protein